MRIAGAALVACLLAAWAPGPAAAAEGYDLLVCYPGGPVKDSQAEGAMGDMLRTIEALGGWPAGTFRHEFTTRLDVCRKKLAERPPHFTILSLGLFLEAREAHHLAPLVQPRIKGQTADVLRVLVRKGTFKKLADLQGKTLGGSMLEEREFLRRVAFEGALDPAVHFQLKPNKRALQSLRKLAKGELDAVLVNQIQYDGLPGLPFARDLEVIHSSAPMPLVGVAADEGRVPAAERKRMAEALAKMCAAGEGAKQCELFGVEAFLPAPADAYQKVQALWKTTR